MPPAKGDASGKIILFGEHAVVYGRPALAVPLRDLRATVSAEPAQSGTGTIINASDVGMRFNIEDAPEQPLAVAAQLTIEHLQIPQPDVILTVESDIPIASGLGSGAAVATALARALAAQAGTTIAPDELSPLIYEVEKLFHGTPSGIDNTVVVYEQPVYFRRNEPPPHQIETFSVGAELHLMLADSGIASPTSTTVADVRAAWQANRVTYEALFDEMGTITEQARKAIEGGDVARIGTLMNSNQKLLRQLNVSSSEIEALVRTAVQAGALGAKLSGGGRGGNVIVLVEPTRIEAVSSALEDAGASAIITTVLRPADGKVSTH